MLCLSSNDLSISKPPLTCHLFSRTQVLGTPTKDELKSMNPNYQEFKFPQIRAYPWGSIFKPSTPPEAIDIIGKLLAYVPDKRLKAIEVSVVVRCQCSAWWTDAWSVVWLLMSDS
jgi:serine/threonine protein kinase